MAAASDEQHALDGRTSGDPDAAEYRAFFLRTYEQVRAAVTLRAANNSLAEDGVQEAFVLARDQWDRLRSYDRPEMWVIKVAWRLVQRWHRRAPHEPLADQDVVCADPAEEVVAYAAVRDAVRGLPRRQAEATILVMLGYSVADTATTLGVAEGTVKSHLFRARRRLKAELGREAR